mgnify:CR=1 FL=1
MDQFETPRLTLLPLQRSHAAELFDVLRDPEIHRFVARTPPASVGELESRYAQLESRKSPNGEEQWLNWAVEERSSRTLVGLIQITVLKDKSALLAYLFSPAVWGRGYAAEGCTRILRELWDHSQVRTVEATTDTRNARSIRLLERLCFRFIEERESDDIIGGEKSREVVYRIAVGSEV